MNRLAAYLLTAALIFSIAPYSQARLSNVSSAGEEPNTIPNYDHQRPVKRWMRYFRGAGYAQLRFWAKSHGKFKKLMRRILKAYDLPEEVMWLSGVESAFQINAVSNKGAAGLWQLIPKTARKMGLRVDRWVDQRYDPEASTIAAGRLLHMLYTMFKDWPLVFAAYHTGHRYVRYQMKKWKTRDFFKLYRHGAFMESTLQYVPKVLAYITLASNREKYGIGDFYEAEPLKEDSVLLPPRTCLRKVCRLARLNYQEIRAKNLVFRRSRTPSRGKPIPLRLPYGKGWRVLATIDKAKPAHPADVYKPLIYKIKPGDSLWVVARRFEVKLSEIQIMNDIHRPRLVQIGRELLIPPPGSAKGRPKQEEEAPILDIKPESDLAANDEPEPNPENDPNVNPLLPEIE